MSKTLNDYLAGIKLGEPREFRNVVVFPLFTAQAENDDYLTLTEALEKKLATITEVGQSGSVPQIKVLNQAD